MIYNFDEIVERRNTNSYKWDDNEADSQGILPMWVADMDFKTAQPIIDELQQRVAHGIFGYAKVPDAFYKATMEWFNKHHGLTIEKNWLLYTLGVVPAISAIIKAMTKPGDKVIVQAPVYNCFYSSIRNNDCITVSNDLIYKDGRYAIDFDDLENKAADPDTKLLLLCNPHNPVGRSWSKEELVTLGNICLQHDVFVVSDEIHCDLVYVPHKHIPFASISQEFFSNSVTCIAPSKTFNLAGLQVANIVVNNNVLKQKIDKAININEVCDISPFAVTGLIAAYTYGEAWLLQLKGYLQSNYKEVRSFFQNELPEFTVLPLEATYLVWIDCSILQMKSDDIEKEIYQKQYLRVCSGTLYGNAGEGFIRLNIACPHSRLVDGLNRLKNILIKLKNT